MTDDSFADLVAAGGPLAADRVARAVCSVAGEVDRRAAAGDPHGRLSPAAITATPDGGVLIDPAAETPTMEFAVHAAPEVIGGAAADARSEVFSLASTAYTLLTGRTPNSFGIATTRRARPDLGPGVEAVLTRATSRDPAFRYPSASDFARALDAALTSAGTPTVAPVARADERTRRSPWRPSTWRRRR
ncbi:hypothetical protein [Tsukamurella pulmonis]|uniref:hypothetical protein n=1 Tax=Tsukamurella pulmonis TaxID=47312 RepID=UPI000E08FB69|nr:hypothetical protein [Tsukamurella pulmonis]RDH12688.1 hypothetical protein DVB88_06235 [Tsukamurella pulmonis]